MIKTMDKEGMFMFITLIIKEQSLMKFSKVIDFCFSILQYFNTNFQLCFNWNNLSAIHENREIINKGQTTKN